MDTNNGFQNNAVMNSQNTEIKQESKKRFLSGMLVGIFICVFIAALSLAVVKVVKIVKSFSSVPIQESESTDMLDSKVLTKIETIEELIDSFYYNEEDIDKQKMIDGMYTGMVEALGDPYSTYYSEEEWTSLMQSTEGIYYGIGAYVSLDETTGYGKIAGIIKNTPAEEVGLRENDIIYLVDGENVCGMDLSSMVSLIKGEEGTMVTLTIYREGEPDYLEIEVERRKIETPTVSSEMLEDDMGYIQITEFDDVTVDQFTEALAEVKGKNAKGLILDLRSNPGGNVSAVVDIARMILPKGLIVYTEDKEGNRDEYSCDGLHELKMPLVVLVDENSASAAEILSGAIKDYEKGTLVGTQTFGKGIVQRLMPLDDGTAVKLTVSAYYTPKGYNIHGIGIEPDVVCEFDANAYYDDGVDNQLEKAKEVLKGLMK